MANLSGKNPGKVQVGDLIARGGMAEVYLGEHTALNRYALGVMLHEMLAGDGYGLLFNGEVGYTAQGYISQVASHAGFAAQALDATENIKVHSAHRIPLPAATKSK